MSIDTVLLRDGGAHQSADRATSRHALPWLKIIVPVDGARVYFGGSREGWTTSPVLTAPHTENVSAVIGPTVTFFFAPDYDGFRTQDQMTSTIDVVQGRRARAVIDAVKNLRLEDATLAIDELTSLLGATQHPRTLDARVREAKVRLMTHPHLDATALAGEVGLSVSRLSHLFTAEMGISLRRYALFRRLVAAFSLRVECTALAEIAQAAGFSDQAHLARTARRFLGQPASYGGRVARG